MRRGLAAGFLALALTLGLSCGDEPRRGVEAAAAEEGGGRAREADAGARAVDAEQASGRRSRRAGGDAGLGEGFLVWESNRSGAWRLWIRDLAGGEPRQLTADEAKRRHCCPHVAPDGGGIAYVSLPETGPGYPEGGSEGPLRIVRPDGGGVRTLAPAARTYFEHRAAVWRSPSELIHIDGERRTVLLDLEAGSSRVLVADPPWDYGWLLDPTLSFAARGRAELARYDRQARRVVPWMDNRGCQPYFTGDGEWYYWMAGVGGPISRIDLGSGESTPVLHKNDERLPEGLGYLYFPMVSPDGLLLAFAASPDEHDHFAGDYEIFVAEIDPERLELIGEPVRMTEHPGTDRFPDVYLAPLALGRRFGEAPLTVEWRLEAGGRGWEWSFGDGAPASGGGAGGRAEHTYDRAGRYEVTARRGGELRRGLVVVRPARPPEPVRAALRESGSEIEVRFDEPVAGEPRASLASGTGIRGWSLSPDGQSLELELARPLAGGDRLSLAGLADRAQRPNPMSPAELDIEPPLWPSRRDGLIFLWQTGDAPNLVADPGPEAQRACTVEPSGRARPDRDFAMVLDRGRFTASEQDARRVLEALRGSNRLGLELRLTPGRPGRILGLADGQAHLVLGLADGELRLAMRLAGRGPDAWQTAAVGIGEGPAHVAFSFFPGRLTARVDGEPAGEWPIQGDFFPWKQPVPLAFGDPEARGDGPPTRLEGIAIYDRVLDAAEVRENHQRYRALVEARPPVPRTVVEARLETRSAAPTLQQISPYDEALVVYEWRLESVVEGRVGGETVRVAHWAILDRRRQPILDAAVGERRRLTLEPFAANPQLETVFVADDLAGSGAPLHYEIDR